MKTEIERTFIPGSEWLYIKIYTGSNTADKILVNIISKIISNLKRRNLIKKWFFIRYMDPDFHLRIRLLLGDPLSGGEILKLFHAKFKSMVMDNQIWKIQVDTYNREIERYGESLIEQTESLFCIDSTYTLKLLKVLVQLPNSSNLRWIFAMQMIDVLLDDFNYSMIEKQHLLEKMDTSFKLEFGFNQFNTKQLNAMYRQYSSEVNSMINNKGKSPEILYLSGVLKERSKHLQKLALQIKIMDKNKESSTLMVSYIHMMMNRIFRSKNRIFELIIYNFLNRIYLSQIARLKY